MCEERTMDQVEHDEPLLPGDPAAAHRARALPDARETLLRQALEARLSSDRLFRLLPAAVKTWKVLSPLMAGEAYARALLACRCERL
jgi:hypothetical protein